MRVWEMVLGIVLTVIGVPLLLISLLLASVLPFAAGGVWGIALVALFIAALGVGLMHDSTCKQKPKAAWSPFARDVGLQPAAGAGGNELLHKVRLPAQGRRRVLRELRVPDLGLSTPRPARRGART